MTRSMGVAVAAVAVVGAGLIVDATMSGNPQAPAHPDVRVDAEGSPSWLGVLGVTPSAEAATPSVSPSALPSGEPSATLSVAPTSSPAPQRSAVPGPASDVVGGTGGDAEPAPPPGQDAAAAQAPAGAAAGAAQPAPPPATRPQAAAPGAATGGAAIEADIFTATNAQRAAHGLPGLRSSSCATSHAQARVAQLVAERAFYHPSLEPVVQDCQAGAGENLALGSRTGAGVVDAWMNSTGHRANLLDPEYTTMGVSCQRQDEYWLCGTVYLMPVDAG